MQRAPVIDHHALMAADQTVNALRRLRALVRSKDDGATGPFGRTVTLPPDLATSQVGALRFSPAEVAAIRGVAAALSDDIRFEHLKDTFRIAQRFAMDCWAVRSKDHVRDFVATHAKAPVTTACLIPVEHLSVEVDTEILGLRLLPTGHPSVPRDDPTFPLDGAVGSVALIEVTGTDPGRMAARARASAEMALRRLRVALRQHRGINDWQLRFSLGEHHAFEGGRGGWRARHSTAVGLGLDASLVELARAHPVAALPAEPATRVQRSIETALGWIERAQFVGDPLLETLFGFFALEAMLGDTATGEKGRNLAFRQAMLSLDRKGHFAAPEGTWILYDEVRSTAVHGEDPPRITRDEARAFIAHVHESLFDFIALVQEKGFTRRSHVVAYLDDHPQHRRMLWHLRVTAPGLWAAYRQEVESDVPPDFEEPTTE